MHITYTKVYLFASRHINNTCTHELCILLQTKCERFQLRELQIFRFAVQSMGELRK